MIFFVVIALSIIITVHEYGHYIVGRWCGIHADVFSLGFGPVLASRVDKRGTKWQIAAIPLGGYVKFLGDGDPSGTTSDEGFLDHMADAERKKEIRRSMMGAPVWARAATVFAGPLFNFIFGALVFAGLYMTIGTATEPPTVGKILDLPISAENQLKPGDTILALNGQETPDFETLSDVSEDLSVTPEVEYKILRDGQEKTVLGPWLRPPYVMDVRSFSAGMDAGLQVGDVITSINDEPVTAFRQIRSFVDASNGNPITLTIWRAGETLELSLIPRMTDVEQADGTYEKRLLIGFSGGFLFEPAMERLGPGKALWNGVKSVKLIMSQSVYSLYSVVSGAISKCNIRSIVGIAEVARDRAKHGLTDYIQFIAALSVAIGLINLFPIPILDGGHLVFHAWEAITRRPPSEGAVRILMSIGLTIIIAFLGFALLNDILCP